MSDAIDIFMLFVHSVDLMFLSPPKPLSFSDLPSPNQSPSKVPHVLLVHR